MGLAETLALSPLPDDLGRVEAELAVAVRHPDRFLGDVASHLVKAGGKRIRPTLTLGASYASTSGDEPASPDAVTGAVAVELVHLGSLYHDDVIDEAETRRNVPSVNARWSNIVAILAGDFLLARASSLAASLGALTRFGTHLGLCYQIVDDCLDLTATDAELGKPVGQDLVEGIYTLPVI